MVVGRCCNHEIYIVCLNKFFECFVHIAADFAISVAHGIERNIQDRFFPTLLPVINPPYNWHEIMYGNTVDESVLTMKLHRLGIMLAEEVESMHQWVVVSKESPHPRLLLGTRALGSKTPLGEFSKLLYESLGDDKLLHTVTPGILIGLLTYHTVLSHSVAHLEGGIHQYAVVSIELFCHHASSRRTDDEVGFLLFTSPVQILDSLMRYKRYIVCHHNGIWHQLTQQSYCSRLCRRCETMHIHHFFPLHQLGKFYMILLFH